MEILNTAQFITERVKVKPITNAEWDKFKKQTENFKYESLLKEGNIVIVKEDIHDKYVPPAKHIVMTKETYNKIFPDKASIVDHDYILCEWDTYLFWSCERFMRNFPLHQNDNTKIIKIIDAGINLKNINTKDDLDKIFDKYRDIQ